MAEVFKANGVVLPSPTAITINDEIVWTSDTGRIFNGTMFGAVITEKKTINITWEYLTESKIIAVRDFSRSHLWTMVQRRQ